jgi:hypothetical protein
MVKAVKFLVETSKTPIYNRIAVAFSNALRELGHIVYLFEPHGIDDSTFAALINSIDIDYYLSTNVFNRLHDYNQAKGEFNFQAIRHKMIFIHHDSAFCPPGTLLEIDRKLEALIMFQENISHFFIEASNIRQFNEMGIKNCHPIKHASEFKPQNRPRDRNREISFVGHLMAGFNHHPPHRDQLGHHLIGLAWNRYSRSSFAIQPEIENLLNDELFLELAGLRKYHRLATQRYLMQLVNQFTMAYRGELISNIYGHAINIYGGDPSYGRINSPLLKLDSPNVIYHPATSNYSDAIDIYATSKINLNISSLQFDSALNNRIIDVVMAGGFVLTDRRSDLFTHSAVVNEISFDTPEELQYRLELLLSPNNLGRYMEIQQQIYEEFKLKYNYATVCEEILRLVGS